MRQPEYERRDGRDMSATAVAEFKIAELRAE